MSLTIALRDDQTAYPPGATVAGTVTWELASPPKRLEVQLIWYTTGKGTRDVGRVEWVTVDAPGLHGTREFAFTLPAGPYSFSGRLITLAWAVEAVVHPGKEVARQTLVMAPGGVEIRW